MSRIKAFIKKYKTPLAFTLFFVFTVAAGFVGPKGLSDEDKSTVDIDTKETRAFITKGNDESLDISLKKESIEVMPDERVTKEDITVLPEAFPDSDYEREPLVTEEDFEKNDTLSAASVSPFSPSFPLSGDTLKPYSVTPVLSATMGDWRSHEGIDISASFGDEVASCEKGTVKAVGKDPLHGFYILISHESGFESFYANLHGEITVTEGQAVPKGHVIGYVGESTLIESADETHLHFELRKNGKRINPEEYIR